MTGDDGLRRGDQWIKGGTEGCGGYPVSVRIEAPAQW